MYQSKILNPELAALLARFRHTNYIVISDLGFPFWPEVPTIDISLTADIPTVRDVLRATEGRLSIGNAWMAEEFWQHNDDTVAGEYKQLLGGMNITYEPHVEFKKRVPLSIGLIRTGDSTPYGNIILESA
ncbi:D-ribose pyranase [Rubellicoccus peritrichatus]|uniref:D-ribose pyranase n=1 Tax=Rubellicoccus peritrichatus TaxID=3080537 RepID=A0AAQ3QSE0_9BACT|nr:D-ribose pyranase [Puniceicoccus sp. CR14]WOO40261.1 D-ribose pyranase [Puniceicoccus sp. CR14]